MSPDAILTAEQYSELPDDGRCTELVRGRIVEVTRPTSAHGYYCAKVGCTIGSHVRANDLGRVVSNRSGVTTRRDPDTVRGPDVAFYSYERVPRGPLPKGYWPAPELVFEVRSPSNTWREINGKLSEYFAANVKVVCVLDPDTSLLWVYTPDHPPRQLTTDQELTLPEVFPDFRVPVREFLG
ncbi:MAG TPA: Uma2 family endonuclease [Urbifossiella sp.]|nr:Uma2 family endonuclease [Urbifossiella sp.]